MRARLAGVIAAAALIAPTAGSATSVSGISGWVVTRQAGGLGCLRASCVKPVPGVMVTFVQGSRVVRARSDRSGRFRIALTPGLWTARASGLLTLHTGPLVIRVSDGRFVPMVFVVRTAAGLR